MMQTARTNNVVNDLDARLKRDGFRRTPNGIGGFNVYLSHGWHFVTFPNLRALVARFATLREAVDAGRQYEAENESIG